MVYFIGRSTRYDWQQQNEPIKNFPPLRVHGVFGHDLLERTIDLSLDVLPRNPEYPKALAQGMLQEICLFQGFRGSGG